MEPLTMTVLAASVLIGLAAASWAALKGWNALPDIYANMQLDNVWLET